MFSQFGPLELILVLVIVLVIFGPKRLPSLGRQLGRGMREFKDSLTGERKAGDDDHDGAEAEAPHALAQAPASDAAGSPAERPSAEPASTEPTSEQRG
jgi:sec-independent protein translocase protein TatA